MNIHFSHDYSVRNHFSAAVVVFACIADVAVFPFAPGTLQAVWRLATGENADVADIPVSIC